MERNFCRKFITQGHSDPTWIINFDFFLFQDHTIIATVLCTTHFCWNSSMCYRLCELHCHGGSTSTCLLWQCWTLEHNRGIWLGIIESGEFEVTGAPYLEKHLLIEEFWQFVICGFLAGWATGHFGVSTETSLGRGRGSLELPYPWCIGVEISLSINVFPKNNDQG